MSNRRLMHFRRERLQSTTQYHAVDKRGWMYLCGCMRSIKLTPRPGHCTSRQRNKYKNWAGRPNW